MKTLLATPLVGLLLPAFANAQVIYATDDAAGLDNYRLDVGTGTSSGPLWSASEAWGLADDDVNGVMYMNTGSGLNAWPYDDTNPPAVLGTITNSVSGATQSMTGMAYDNGVLYAGPNIGVEGVYTIDVVTQVATEIWAFANPADIDTGGLDFDPATGLLYGSNDDATFDDGMGNSGVCIVELDITAQTQTFIENYPAGEIDIDGLAFDPAGVVYLIEDEPAVLHNYSLAGMAYDPAPPMNSILGSEIFSSGTYTAGVGSGGDLGTIYCDPQPVNSTGLPGEISASGSDVAANDDLTLTGSNLPDGEFAFFIGGRMQGFIPNPQGSQGNLCLSGAIARFNRPGELGAISGGTFSLAVPTTDIPEPPGFGVSILAGETWNFQLWHRDLLPTGPTSNFTNAIEILFQ